MSALNPLAKALLEAQPDGTWSSPLDWLAKQVLRKGNTSFGQVPWVPKDATDFLAGWALGMGMLWRREAGTVLARSDGLPGWWYVLGAQLRRSLHSDTPDDDCIAALAEAVKAMTEAKHD